ncbi:hypothetical protein Bca4012_030095 [Brassica carinata]
MGSLKILSVVFVPEIVCHKRDLSKSFDPKALPGEQVAESTKKGLKERLARWQGAVFRSEKRDGENEFSKPKIITKNQKLPLNDLNLEHNVFLTTFGTYENNDSS